jgi:DNA-binding transcriptional LysR family regulator
MYDRVLDRIDWGWLRDFAVVAEEGSLSAASRRLGISQPTLTRRMSALEERLGSEVLRRGSRGVELTEVGEAILPAVRRMREEVRDVDRTATGRDAALSGTVRVSATEGIANHWCTPVLRDFQLAHPEIRIEMDVRNRNANLLRREADVAVRMGRPRQPELVARRVGAIGLGLFASSAYLERAGRPRSADDLVDHACVAFDESMIDTATGRWFEEVVAGGRIVFRATSLLTQLEAVRSGWGIGVASIFIGRSFPDLERVVDPVGLSIDVWLVTHPGLRRSARIRAVFDFLKERFEVDGERLAGRA